MQGSDFRFLFCLKAKIWAQSDMSHLVWVVLQLQTS